MDIATDIFYAVTAVIDAMVVVAAIVVINISVIIVINKAHFFPHFVS
jgi:hypothetical protein